MSASRVERVLVIGLDGAAPAAIETWRARGLVPNLDALVKRGALGTVRSCVPYITPAAWTTFMTGSSPRRHRILDFQYYDAQRRQILMNHSGRIACPTLWHALEAAGRTVVSLGLPMTYPAPVRRGIIVGGLDAPSLDAALASTGDFGRRLRAEVPEFRIHSVWREAPTDFESLGRLLRQTETYFRAQARAARLADEMSEWSVMLVQFQELDPLEHRLWPYLRVESRELRVAGQNTRAVGNGGGACSLKFQPPVDFDRWCDEVEKCVRAMDGCVGELVELAQRRRAAVVVVSDHGFGPCYGKVSVNRLLLETELLEPPTLVDRAVSKLWRWGRQARKVAFRVRTKGGSTAALGRSLFGVVAMNWRRTLAFAPHGNLAGLIYLNTTARHRQAPITSEQQAERVAGEVEMCLREVRDPETGAALFEDVIRVGEAFGCDAAREGLPDIIAVPAPGYQTRLRMGPKRVVDRDPGMPGTHRLEGVLALDAPGVVAGSRLEASLTDVAPTLLALLGEPVPAFMEGRVLAEAFGEAPVSGPGRSAAPEASGAAGFGYSEEEYAEIERRLSGLGYLD